MANYSFKETLAYFCDKLQTQPPEEDLKNEAVELLLDELRIVITKGALEGCLNMQIMLGLMLQPIREQKLKELATSNFLGINTGGCTLAFDEPGVSLSLLCHTSSGTTPQENWEWLHRVVAVAREWNKVLALWDEFVPLHVPKEEKSYEPANKAIRQTFRG